MSKIGGVVDNFTLFVKNGILENKLIKMINSYVADEKFEKEKKREGKVSI